MKLKYYLRGLGTGILVTALVLGFALSHGKGTMSDEEVKERASELGMVEEFQSLAETSEKKTEKNENENVAGVTRNSEKSWIVSENATSGLEAEQEQTEPKTDAIKDKQTEPETDAIKDKQAEPETDVIKDKQTEPETEPLKDDKIVILEVSSGDGSMMVARKAEASGLVESAAEFDTFLCKGGYDKKICTGKHKIPAGASMEEIAKLLISKP